MGGGGSKIALPPVIKQDPYPTAVGLNNLSLAPGTTSACKSCDISIDSRATISSVKLTRDFGDVSSVECQSYQKDLQAVRDNEMSFRDFFVKLQAGNYTRPIARTSNGEFCEQVLFSDEDAAKVNSLADFDTNIAKLKNIRIRKVTGGGSFSSGTKAKFKLSIPVTLSVVVEIKGMPPARTEMRYIPKVHFVTLYDWGAGQPIVPVTGDVSISTLTMYHPSPLRIENVQHDAVLSLNDPSDSKAEVVFLIPLKSSNTNDQSVEFFNRIAKHLNSIQEPDSVTGLYSETNIPTGNDWNIKQLFWLACGGADNMSKVEDAFYTWIGAGTYKRVEKSRRRIMDNIVYVQDEITYGWEPEGKQVRYYMLQTPVSISPNDLSILTRVLPPTPAEEAIHKIPDPGTAGNPKILYKKATGRGAKGECGIIRERMTNNESSQVVSSLFTNGGGVEDLLEPEPCDAKGNPLSEIKGCDPFKKNLTKEPSMFTPHRVIAIFFNILVVIAIGLGAWLAMFLVANQDYDFKFRDFASDTGKVVGKLAKRAAGASKVVSGVASSIRAVSSGLSQKGSPTDVPGAAVPEPAPEPAPAPAPAPAQ